jgi:hypothetical protein
MPYGATGRTTDGGWLPGHVVEDGVGGEKMRADVGREGRDPEVVGMDRIVQRMSRLWGRSSISRESIEASTGAASS